MGINRTPRTRSSVCGVRDRRFRSGMRLGGGGSAWLAALVGSLAAPAFATSYGCGGSTVGEPRPPATRSPDGECDLAKPFGLVRALSELGSQAGLHALTADELTIFYVGFVGGAGGLQVASRASVADPFEDAAHVTGLDGYAGRVSVSPDGTYLYLAVGNLARSNFQLRRAQRVSRTQYRLEPEAFDLGGTNNVSVSADGLTLTAQEYFEFINYKPLLTWSRGSLDDPWVGPTVLADEARLGVVSSDGKRLLYARGRNMAIERLGGAPRPLEVVQAVRSDRTQPFGPPTVVVDYEQSGVPSWLSENGCRLYVTPLNVTIRPPGSGFAGIKMLQRPR